MYPSFFQSVLLVIIIFGFFILFNALFKFIAISIIHDPDYKFSEIYFQAAYTALMIAVIWFANKKSGMKTSSLFKLNFGPLPILLIIPVMTIGFSIVFSECENILKVILKYHANVSESPLFTNSMTGFLLGCIIAPLLEETLFRGIILKGFLKRYPAIVAILLSALVFGIAHPDPIQLAGAFLFGLFLAWICIKTGSVFSGMWAHVWANVTMYVVSLDILPYIQLNHRLR
jgi:membrane protease YdiL (CAAX protease family)